MGNGRWTVDDYTARAQMKAAAGVDTFDYSNRARESGDLRPHQTLDPMNLTTRESRDNAEHPESNAIIISLDVTGSMGRVVRGIHRNLPQLLELLLGHKFVSDPQILFSAVGDATCDRVPLQIGQFESDNRMDENLENMVLEGGGGGQNTESYELMLYAAARHTDTDCWNKRKRKGYLFIIGDEKAYSHVRRAHVQRCFGTDPQADIPLSQIVAEVKERFHLYFVIPGGASNGNDQTIIQFWEAVVGPQHVIKLENPDDTSESIAMTIGLNEGIIAPGEAQNHLADRGVHKSVVDRLLSALGSMFAGSKS
ncbi:MAG TPA: hypothetical protein PK402_00930 [Tepidisphaeraceae bacterium]|nr:hypothetical protein [Tepidisphaeraceae bacterium]